jgi:hypothetical protein
MDLTTSQFAGALRTEVISRRDPGEAADRYGDRVGGIGVGIARKKSFRIRLEKDGSLCKVYEIMRVRCRTLGHGRREMKGHIREDPGFT